MIEIDTVDNYLVRTTIKLNEKLGSEPNKYYGGIAHNYLKKKQIWDIFIYCKTSPYNPIFTKTEFLAKGMHDAIAIANRMTSEFNSA